MKVSSAILVILSILNLSLAVVAAEPGNAKAELEELVKGVKARIQQGKRSEADFGGELKQFDDLLAAHKGEKTEDVAEILFMKAMLYVQVFDDAGKGQALIKQVKADFPDTPQGKNADKVLDGIAKQAEEGKIRKSLVEGGQFPDFSEKDLDGKPLSVSGFKGKIVMVDFWATWCGPCVAELPNVLETYGKYHDKGLEIIGISLDKDKEKLAGFIKERGISWQQYFDGQGWQNKLAIKYGVNSIPATYLLDKEGKILGKDLRGEALGVAVAKALGAQ